MKGVHNDQRAVTGHARASEGTPAWLQGVSDPGLGCFDRKIVRNPEPFATGIHFSRLQRRMRDRGRRPASRLRNAVALPSRQGDRVLACRLSGSGSCNGAVRAVLPVVRIVGQCCQLPAQGCAAPGFVQG